MALQLLEALADAYPKLVHSLLPPAVTMPAGFTFADASLYMQLGGTLPFGTAQRSADGRVGHTRFTPPFSTTPDDDALWRRMAAAGLAMDHKGMPLQYVDGLLCAVLYVDMMDSRALLGTAGVQHIAIATAVTPDDTMPTPDASTKRLQAAPILSNARKTTRARAFVDTFSAALETLAFVPTTLQLNVLARLHDIFTQPMAAHVGCVLCDSSGNGYLASPYAPPGTRAEPLRKEDVHLVHRAAAVVATATGTGKTLVGLFLAAFFAVDGLPNLVVVPDRMVRTWRSEAQRHGIDALPGMVFLETAADVANLGKAAVRVYVANVTALHSPQWRKLGLKHFGTTVVDDAHLFLSYLVSWRQTFGGGIRHDRVVALTSTPAPCWADIRRTVGLAEIVRMAHAGETGDTCFISNCVLRGERNQYDAFQRRRRISVVKAEPLLEPKTLQIPMATFASNATVTTIFESKTCY